MTNRRTSARRNEAYKFEEFEHMGAALEAIKGRAEKGLRYGFDMPSSRALCLEDCREIAARAESMLGVVSIVINPTEACSCDIAIAGKALSITYCPIHAQALKMRGALVAALACIQVFEAGNGSPVAAHETAARIASILEAAR